jgi:hypothetical protein
MVLPLAVSLITLEAHWNKRNPKTKFYKNSIEIKIDSLELRLKTADQQMLL